MAAPIVETLQTVVASCKIPFSLKVKQVECLKHLSAGKDVFAVLPTGYGKSVIYSILPKLWRSIETVNQTSTDTESCIVMVVSPLISLMKDQVQNIATLGIDSIYLGESHSAERIDMIKKGLIPLIMLSPESLFSGSWRDLVLSAPYQHHLHTIVIDECHCVEEWGAEFRTDYSRLAELRSLLPKANMLALTATATPSDRKKISKVLCMESFIEVVASCDRPNIKHVCIKAPGSFNECFSWLCQDIKAMKENATKSIIYCRNIKSCGLIYHYLLSEIGSQNSYIGTCSASNRLFSMFHHSTAPKNKKIIMDSFCKTDSTLRVVIATTAFGMGVNVPDVRVIVHWGAPHSIQGYMQQSGRAGRDGKTSLSVVYYHPADISTVATDSSTREFCLLNTCRREFLLKHFTPEYEEKTQGISLCMCCDNCKLNCECGNCPADVAAVLDLDEGALINAVNMLDEPLVREVQDVQRMEMKVKLYELRAKLLGDTSTSMLNIGLITGLSDRVINDIVANAHYIFSVEDILAQYIFHRACAIEVFDIIENVIQEK